MTPEYLGGVYQAEQVQIDLQALCIASDVEFVKGRAVELDTENRKVVTDRDRIYQGGIVVFNIGSRTPGRVEHPHISVTKPLHRIEKLASFLEELVYGPHQERKNLAIVGGGPAGVEIALNISARMRANGKQTPLVVTLIEAEDRLVASLPSSMSTYASEMLRQRGVDVRLQRKAEVRKDQMLRLDDGHEFQTDFVLWATGTIGQPIFREAGLKCDKNDFLYIDDTMRHPQHPWLFAAGDCTRVIQYPDLQKIGVHAVKQGEVLLQNVERTLTQGQGLEPSSNLAHFHPYAISPIILSTGTGEALWTSKKYWIHNKLMLRLKHYLDLRWVEQYRYPYKSQTSLKEKLHARNALGN